jgi:hypothetical protein
MRETVMRETVMRDFVMRDFVMRETDAIAGQGGLTGD